jgi:hypothetical protein
MRASLLIILDSTVGLKIFQRDFVSTIVLDKHSFNTNPCGSGSEKLAST